MNIARIVLLRMPYILAGLFLHGPANSQDAQTTLGVETPVRGDPKHPFTIGENYPAESKVKGEEGVCVVRIEVDADGVVRATQLVFTSGFARLDGASLAGFTAVHMIPATISGKTVTTWVNIPISWNLSSRTTYRAHKVEDNEIHIPIIQKNYRLKVGPGDYPPESRSNHQEGDCTIHALIDKDGIATDVSVRRSTGFATLDQACVTAIQQAPFVPAHKDGEAVSAFTTINMNWRLTQ
jgi:TonB family protein